MGGITQAMGGKPTPKIAEAVTSQSLSTMADELEALAADLRKAASAASAQPTKCLAMYNVRSGYNGLKALMAFVQRARESRIAASSGRPIPIGQRKPRSRIVEHSDSRIEAELIEDELSGDDTDD